MKVLLPEIWILALAVFPVNVWSNPCERILAHRDVSEQELKLFARLVAGDEYDALVYADFLEDKADSLSLARAGAIRYKVGLDRLPPGFFRRFLSRRTFTEAELAKRRALAGWHNVERPRYGDSQVEDPSEFSLWFFHGVPISAYKVRSLYMPYFTSSLDGASARRLLRFPRPELAEVHYAAELALWLRVPTLISVLNQNQQNVEHPLSLWGEPTVIRAAVQGVLGALYCADRDKEFYSRNFFFLLHEVMRHGMEGTSANVSPLILSRIGKAAANLPEGERAWQIVRTLWFDPPTEASFPLLLQVPFYPYFEYMPPTVQDQYWVPRMQDFFFFRGDDGVLPTTLLHRLVDVLWEKLERFELGVEHLKPWKDFLAQPVKTQRASARQIFRELLRRSKASPNLSLSTKLAFLGPALDRTEEKNLWDF